MQILFSEYFVLCWLSHNYTPYDGDDSFLEGPTEATDKLWGKLQELQKERGAQIAELQAEKRRLVDAKVLPYKAEAEQRMRDMAQQQHAQAMQQLKSPEERDKEMLDAAMAKSQGGLLKFNKKKRVDRDGFTVLYEKDFAK